MIKQSLTLLVIVATALLANGSTTRASAGRVPAKTIATVTSVDYRAAVSAREGSHGSAPTAAVTITSYTRSGGRWILARNQRLPGTYFWKTVTAKGALCRLELSTAGPAPPRVIIRLLLSPALGCGRTHTVALSPA